MNTPDVEKYSQPAVLAYDDGTHGELPAVVLGYIVLKAMGLWMAISLLQILIYFLMFAISPRAYPVDDWTQAVVSMVPSTCYGIVGVMTMVYALPLSRRYFSMPGPVVTRPVADTFVALIAVGVGLYLIASNVISVIHGAILLFSQFRAAGGRLPPGQTPDWWVIAIARVAVGIALFLRPDWVVGYWRKRTRMP